MPDAIQNAGQQKEKEQKVEHGNRHQIKPSGTKLAFIATPWTCQRKLRLVGLLISMNMHRKCVFLCMFNPSCKEKSDFFTLHCLPYPSHVTQPPAQPFRRRRQTAAAHSTHDFPDKELGKAVLCGIYDIATNGAGVTVGVSCDTAKFAVAAIEFPLAK